MARITAEKLIEFICENLCNLWLFARSDITRFAVLWHAILIAHIANDCPCASLCQTNLRPVGKPDNF